MKRAEARSPSCRTAFILYDMALKMDFRHTFKMRLDPEQKAELRRIASELAAIARRGEILPGSITQRLTVCGRANCACQADPPRRHGPYWLWTRKVAAKTVSRWFTAEQAQDYDRWVNNSRRLRQLVADLEAMGIAAADADPRNTRGTPRAKQNANKQKD